jgi:LmbE family N-acetylglucosaminyl deacetylase
MTIEWSSQRVLVIAPHPDDEVIGCGGLMSRVKRVGGEVYVQFMTVGDTADFSAAGWSTASERQVEIDQVTAHFKLDGYHVAFPGSDHHLRLDASPRHELITMLERDSPLSLTALAPTVVLLPDRTSYNQDHRVTAEAVITALRPGDAAVKHQPSIVLGYEEVADGWTAEPLTPPEFFVELEEQDLDHKLNGLALYASQTREHPSTRSDTALRSLAAVRGAQSGSPWAEAYHCLRFRA